MQNSNRRICITVDPSEIWIEGWKGRFVLQEDSEEGYLAIGGPTASDYNYVLSTTVRIWQVFLSGVDPLTSCH